MKRVVGILLIIALMLSLFGCSGADKRALADVGGVDLRGGDIIFSEDTHGGIHYDGRSLIKVRYSDASTAEKIAASDKWRALPFSDNLETFVYQYYNSDSQIPKIENGYYYFYDRHNDSKDRYSDADLLNRPSFNLTFAVYDADSQTLYFCTFDT